MTAPLIVITSTTDVGNAIAHLRTMNMITQSSLATMAGVFRSRLGDYEHGRYTPTLATLLDLLRPMDLGLAVIPIGENTPAVINPEWETVINQLTSLIRHTAAGTTDSVNNMIGANRAYRRVTQAKS